MKDPRRKASIFHVSHILGEGRKKKKQKPNKTKTTQHTKKCSPTSSQSACELAGVPLRRNEQLAQVLQLAREGGADNEELENHALQFLFLEYQRCSTRTSYFKEKIPFSRFWGSEEVLIRTLQLLSSACRSPNLRKHFQQLSFRIWIRPLTFAADGQRHSLYRLVKLLHVSINSLHRAGTKRNLQRYYLNGDGKAMCARGAEGQHNSPVQPELPTLLPMHAPSAHQQGIHTQL